MSRVSVRKSAALNCVVNIMLCIVYSQKTKVSSYSHMLPWYYCFHICASCTNHHGIYILQCSCKCSLIMHGISTNSNDTRAHCQLLSLWIIPVHRPGTMLYYVHKQHTFICALQHTLAYKLTYGGCDMHMFSKLIYDYCNKSLFVVHL